MAEHLYRATITDPATDRTLRTYALADVDLPTCRVQVPHDPQRWLHLPLTAVVLGAQVGIEAPGDASAAWQFRPRQGWTFERLGHNVGQA